MIIRDLPYRSIERLSECLKGHGGTYMIRPGSSGGPTVDAVCSFPTMDQKMLFKLEWAAD